MRTTRTVLSVLAAGLVLASAAPAMGGVAADTTGVGAAPMGGGTAPVANPSSVVTFLAELPHRTTALEQAATAISTPGSPSFRQYLTVEEAAQRYGATSAQIAAVRKAARSLGLRAEIDPTGLLVRISGPVSAWEKAMGAPVQFTPAIPGAPYDKYVFPRPTTEPTTPAGVDLWRFLNQTQLMETRSAPPAIARTVKGFVASYWQYVPAMDVPASANAGAAAVRSGEPKGTGVRGGPQPRSIYGPGGFTQEPATNPAAALMESCVNKPGAPLAPQTLLGQPLSADGFVSHEQVFRAYGLPTLQRDEGANASGRVSIISLGGGYSDADLAQAASCFGFTVPEVRITRGTGVGTPIVTVDGETTLDVQTVSATLKNAKAIQLVQVAESDVSVAFADGYSRALTATPRPHAITLSYGSCEPFTAPFGLAPAVGSLFQFAAVVGTTITVSAGDDGSSACQAELISVVKIFLALLEPMRADLADAQGDDRAELEALIAELEGELEPLLLLASYGRPTVDFPASSPWATAVGGTQILMNPDGTRAAEVVWNEQAFSGGRMGNQVGGGGSSAAFNAPAYQRPLSWSNTRSVPDISAMAGPYPSLPIVLRGTISQDGGTSQSSPMMAAALALLSAQEVSEGRPRLGFVNPWLYDVVRRHPQTVYDVTIGDNQYAVPLDLEGNSLNIPACCQADLGYDQASGLGVLDFSELRNHTSAR